MIRQVYDQMANPKWVISMGVCASSGGMFNNYAIVQGCDHIVPVDIYLPGCPPRPEMLIDAIVKLHDQIENGKLGKNRERQIEELEQARLSRVPLQTGAARRGSARRRTRPVRPCSRGRTNERVHRPRDARPGSGDAPEENVNLPARAGEERLAEQVVRHGMFGTETSGDTSGYGRLLVRLAPELSSPAPLRVLLRRAHRRAGARARARTGPASVTPSSGSSPTAAS